MGAPVITIPEPPEPVPGPGPLPALVPATAFRRLAALAYDGLVLAGVVMITSFLVVMSRGSAVPPGARWFQVLVAAQIAAFFIGFWWLGGQTPGMRAWALRLTMRDGSRLPLRIAVARFFLACVSAAAAGSGFLAMARDPQQQAWHDRILGTVLVRTRSATARGRPSNA